MIAVYTLHSCNVTKSLVIVHCKDCDPHTAALRHILLAVLVMHVISELEDLYVSILQKFCSKINENDTLHMNRLQCHSTSAGDLKCMVIACAVCGEGCAVLA